MNEPTKCAFCDKKKDEVAFLVARQTGDLGICSECISVALELMSKEALVIRSSDRIMRAENKTLRRFVTEAVHYVRDLGNDNHYIETYRESAKKWIEQVNEVMPETKAIADAKYVNTDVDPRS